MKLLDVTHLAVLVSLIPLSRGQLIVQNLATSGFGHSNDIPATPSSYSTKQAHAIADLTTPSKAGVNWKQAVARLATGQDASKAGNSYEQHKQQLKIDAQIEDLKHAQGALGYLEERASNKLQADIDEIDHLIVRRHALTDKKAENDKDIATIENNIVALRKVAASLVVTQNVEEEKAVNKEVSDLTFAAASLRGHAGEVQELSHEIEASTADGRKMDKHLRHLARERAAIGRQVRVLKQEGDELLDTQETARDFAAFARQGYDSMDDKDDPYMKEAAAALEKASGWDKEKLDAEAIKRREIMTKGLAANPGQAVQALKSFSKRR